MSNDRLRVFAENIDATKFLSTFKGFLNENSFVECAEDADIILRIRDDLSFPAAMRSDVRSQAYRLDVNSRQIELRAISANGLFLGLQTLRQMLEQSNGQLHCINITDWPNMPFRGVHLTLANNMPTFEKLKELIVNMSRCKINKFVLEYDDKFPFEKHPIIVHPSALTKDQIRELIAFGKNYFIDIIPLLDSLGHAQAYLTHDEYQHLAELPGNTAEMCSSNPETLKFIKELWAEILEVHEDCEFAHITGDEVFRLGDFCPKCRESADSNRLSELFFSYYKDLSEWMLERGKRPIMWADIALKYPESVSVMPKEVIFNDWEYRGNGSEWSVARIFKEPGMTIDKYNLDAIPIENREYFNKYYLNEDKTTFKPYPGIGILKDYGFEAIGSSASSTESGKMPVPPFRVAINNNRYNSKAAAESGALGLLNTFWSNYRDIANAMHGVWAGGAYSWKFVEESNDDFLNKCQNVFMNSNTGEFAKYAAAIDSFDLPRTGPSTPITEDSCAKFADFPLPPCDTDYDPIVRCYLAGLEANALAMVKKQQSLALEDKQRTNEIGAGDYFFIDLSKEMNINHASSIHIPGRNFAPMGCGNKSCRGVAFNIIDPKDNADKSALGLRGGHRPDWLENAKIEVNDTFDKLFFLNGCAYAPRGETLAICEIHYDDGSLSDYKFVVGKNISDWHQGDLHLPAGTPAFTWYGYDDAGPIQSSYMSWWINPAPKKKISHLQLRPESSSGYIFFFAITGRKMKII